MRLRIDRTIEARLDEVLEALDNTTMPAASSTISAYNLVNRLLQDFRAEGIEGRTIGEQERRENDHHSTNYSGRVSEPGTSYSSTGSSGWAAESTP